MAITWTKEWEAADDGTIISGLDLKNIQDDITSGSTGDATSIWSVPVVQPTAADNGKVLFYDHSSPAFDYLAISGIIPTGVILIWSGAISAIPTGWALCDGTAGTPNLTDRFVIHADADAAGTNNVGDSGGVKTHTLSTAEMPLHGHAYRNSTGLSGDDPASGGLMLDSDGTQATQAAFTGAPSNTLGQQIGGTGGGTAHTNRDKYYSLAYIMKT